MKRVIVALALVVIGFVTGSVAFADGPPPARVKVDKVVKEQVFTTQSVTGVLYYERVSQISTEVMGLVDEVKVSQGDQVAKGAPLVQLNTELLEKDIALTRTRIEQSELRIQHAEKNYRRLDRLYRDNGVSEKDYDDAVFAYQDAQMDKKASEDSLAKLLLQRRRSLINAPFDGIVLTKDVDSGAWVQQGRQLVSIGSSSDLYVRAPIAENLLRFVEQGTVVEVELNAFNRRVEGTVVGIDPVADLKTKNIFLKIKIAPMDVVAENMSATVYVPSSDKRELSVFNRAALIKFQGKDFVYTIKEGKAAILPVNIVSFLGKKVAVDNPYIVPGMVVVVEGNERLRPDQPVAVAGE